MIYDLRFTIWLKGAALALLLSTLNLHLSTAFAQGSLTPPGAPAPTMKSLDQIEARTPISAPATIGNPGSYYLTGDITTSSNAITITASGVTLDLNGFSIISTGSPPANSVAIQLGSGVHDITICNGHIVGGVTNNGSSVYSGNGFGEGITYFSSPPVNVRVSRVSVSGCLYDGIFLNTGDSTVVESCTVRTVGNDGIVASTIKQSSALNCGDNAIYGDQVSDCQGQSSGDGDGIFADTAQNCVGASDGSGHGIEAESTALNCNGYSSSGAGVSATTAQNCQGISGGGGDGVEAENALNYEGTSDGSGAGVVVGANASGCYGNSYSGPGVSAASGIASDCYGSTANGATGLHAFIANSCSGSSLDLTHGLNSY